MIPMASRERVHIVDVAPRDGLQSDAVTFTTPEKLELIERIARCGVDRVEVASFVHPDRVPQMADAEAVYAGLAQRFGAAPPAGWIGLVLNARGLDRALAAGATEVNVVVACSDTFSERNQGVDTDTAIATAAVVVERARAAGVATSVTISTAFGCAYEGEISTGRLVEVATRVATCAPDELAIADTIGAAVPVDVRTRVEALQQSLGAGPRLRVHFHDTRSTGVANAVAAAEAGVRVVDASLGGVGGCPFSPRATGNVATEDVVYALERSGFDTGVDLDALVRASEWFAQRLGRDLPGHVARSAPFPAR